MLKNRKNIKVVKRGGQKLSLKTNLNKALQALYKDRCLVLKGAISVKPASPEHLASLNYIKRDIVLNKINRSPYKVDKSYLLTILSFICYYWLLRLKPYLKKQPIPNMHAVVVLYLGKGFFRYGKINHQVGDKIEELAGNNCSYNNNYII
ncbi:hypothetical protein V2W45_1463682 [Cenococcum geophilum]